MLAYHAHCMIWCNHAYLLACIARYIPCPACIASQPGHVVGMHQPLECAPIKAGCGRRGVIASTAWPVNADPSERRRRPARRSWHRRSTNWLSQCALHALRVAFFHALRFHAFNAWLFACFSASIHTSTSDIQEQIP